MMMSRRRTPTPNEIFHRLLVFGMLIALLLWSIFLVSGGNLVVKGMYQRAIQSIQQEDSNVRERP